MRMRRALGRWIRRVDSGWGPRAGASLRDGIDLCRTDGSVDLRILATFLARRGHTVDDVVDWVDDLYHHQPRAAKRAFGERGVVQLAAGWAEGRLQMPVHVDRTVPMENFRLRMRQQFQLATSQGVEVNAFIALVVVSCEPTTGGSDLIERVCGHVVDVFCAGETVTEHDSGKLLVLTERAPTLPGRLADLRTRLQRDPALHGSRVRLWVESVGPRVEVVDDLLDSLLV